MFLMKIILVCFILMHEHLEATAQQIGRAQNCPANWALDSKRGNCYHFSDRYATYDGAVSNCREMFSSLATLLDPGERYFLDEQIHFFIDICSPQDNCLQYWVALTYRKPTERLQWKWFSGLSAFYDSQSWAPYVPTNISYCASLDFREVSSRGKLFSYYTRQNCENRMRYICKRECPEGFGYLEGTNACYKVIPQYLTWEEASRRCRNIPPRGHLAMITSSAESEQVTKYLRALNQSNAMTCNNLWIGAQRRGDRCTSPLVWKPYGTVRYTLNFTNWYPGEPRCENSRVLGCAMLRARSDYQWSTESCDIGFCPLCRRSL